MAVAAVVGVAVVALAWWLGPGLFGAGTDRQDARVMTATVTDPVPCTTSGARETVRFTLDGQQRSGMLSACGHDSDERVRVALPAQSATPGEGPVEVGSAVSSSGYSALLGPIALVLLALSCGAGGVYAFLVVRGPRPRPAMA